jgi:4-hydroxy-tetrahydrodipicolinate synthase
MSRRTAGYGGVIAAALTPCAAPGVPDPDTMRTLSRTLVQRGCHGLFVVGSTGELPLLDVDQRRDLVAAAREGAGPEAALYAGVSGFGVEQTVRYARFAAEDGADIAVIMAPFFLKASQTGLYDYVRRIADASPLPLGIYSHYRMPAVFEVQTLTRLAEHPNIVAVKDTHSDAARIAPLTAALTQADIAVLQGREPFILDSLRAGADGCVSALANVAPELHRRLYEAFRSGNEDEALAYQQGIDRLGRIFKLPGVQASFAGFGYALREIARLRGWLECVDGMMPGLERSDNFDRQLRRIAAETGLI